MSKAKILRCYDYVNHPYAFVRDVLKKDATNVFSNATKTAALRAQSLVSELHVNIGGLEVGTDISISVNKIEDIPKKVTSPPETNIQLEWSSSKLPNLFPFMKGELSIYPITATETQLDFHGEYEVPLGLVGNVIDAVLGKRIAEASVLRFVKDVAAYLRKELD